MKLSEAYKGQRVRYANGVWTIAWIACTGASPTVPGGNTCIVSGNSTSFVDAADLEPADESTEAPPPVPQPSWQGAVNDLVLIESHAQWAVEAAQAVMRKAEYPEDAVAVATLAGMMLIARAIGKGS